MGVVLPDWAATMLDLIGVSWPNVDEDDYHHTADSLRNFAHDLDDNTGAANRHMQRLLASGRGQSMQALGAHWGKVKDKHLKDLATATTVIAGALDLAAGAITAQKGEAITQLGYLADETGIALALIPETGGLSALLDAGAIEATQQVVKQLFQAVAKDAVSYIVSALAEPAVSALDGMAVDLAIQLAADGMGVQNGVNLNEVQQAGKDGFHQGVGSAKTALHLDSVGGGDGGAAGGGSGGSDDVLIDHAEHERASTHLNVVGASMHGKTRGHIFKARGHLGRTRGRGVIAEAIEPVADKAVNALEKAATELGDHVKDRLPKAVQQISKDFGKADQDIKDGFNKLDKHHGRDGDFHLASRGPGRDPRYSKPDSLSDAKSDPRRHGIALNDKTCEGDPVDVATGEMTLPQTDLSLPGVLPLVLRRTHLSGYRYGQWFGRSWASTLDERIELDSLGTGAVWAREDGSLLVYPRLPHPAGEPVLPLEGPRLPLAHGGDDSAETTYQVTDPHSGLTRSFSGSPYNESTAYWVTEITDRNNNRITIDRHADGTPTAVTHHGGYAVNLTAQDARIRTLALRTPDGLVTVMTYGYDDTGNVNAITNSSGLPLRFTYNNDGRITSWTDRNNSTFQYVYDSDGRVVRTIGPDGYLSSSFTYELHPETGQRITRYTNSTGATTVYHLNDRLQVVAETDPLDNTTLQTWDPYDHPLTRTDPLGHTTSWTWDDAGNLTALHLPDGTVSRLGHNDLNQVTEFTAADGAIWTQSYDERGNRTSFTLPDGTTTRYAYNATGHLTTVTDARGNSSQVDCDRAGLPLTVTGPLGDVTHYERDPFGRPRRITDPLGNTTELAWTIEGKIARRTAPGGIAESWTYDGEGNCLTHLDALGRTSRFEYTHFDQLAARTTTDGTRHEFQYDTELRLTKVTNPQQAAWNYQYDAAGRLIHETDFDARTLTYTHDAAGRLARRTNGMGESIHFERDEFGRVITKDAAGSVTRFTYDAVGRLTHAVSPDAELTLNRDRTGRVLSESCNGRILSHAYDELGRRIRRTTPAGTTSNWTYPQGEGRHAELDISGHTLTFQFDQAGREISRQIDGAVDIAQSWDAHGRLTEQLLTGADGLQRQHRRYTYRPDGNLTAVDETSGGYRAFTLDAADRVTAVQAHNWSEQYAYDETGNQTAAAWPDTHPNQEATGTRTYQGTRITRAGSIRYEHDAQGRVTLRQKTRLSHRPDTWRYTWDAEDRLTSVSTPDGSVWRYQYDPLGRRIAKQHLTSDGQQLLEQVDFTWDGDTLCEQTTHTPNTPASTTLTWEHDGLKPVAQTERRIRSDAPQDEIDQRFFAIVTDLIGTPRELIDENGDIAWHTRTTLWGLTTWNRTATAYTPLRFPGQYFDPETGLHYNRFRYYDPHTARYLSLDPLGLTPAPNPTTYVDNPTTWIDPLGLSPCQPVSPAFEGDPYHPDEVQKRIDAGRKAWAQIPREVHNTVNGVESGRVTQRINSDGPDWFNANGNAKSPWRDATIFTGVGSPTTLTRVLVRSDGVVGYVLDHNYNNVIEYGYAKLPSRYVPRPQ